IEIDIIRMEARFETLNYFNFEEKVHCNKNIDDNANELVALFSEACINRVNSARLPVLSLSGGLDSRSVGACLQRNEISFSAVTFLDNDLGAESDVKIAEKLADVFK